MNAAGPVHQSQAVRAASMIGDCWRMVMCCLFKTSFVIRPLRTMKFLTALQSIQWQRSTEPSGIGQSRDN